MRLPAESSSSWSHIGFASFTLGSLRAWSEFSDLEPSRREVLAASARSLQSSVESLLKKARETQDRVIFGRPTAQAKQNASLTLLRRRLAEALGFVSAKVGGGSKDHPRVREFLPQLLAGITRAPLADRPRLAAEAATRLEASTFALPDKAELVARLKEAAEGAKMAIDAAEKAWSAWTMDRSEEVLAKGRLRLELERIYGLLRAEFPGQSSFVESFFLRGDRPTEGPAEEPQPAGDTGTPA